LTGDQEGGQGGDGSEHAEGDRLGFGRPLDPTLGHRGHKEGVRGTFGDEPSYLPFNCGHVAAAAPEAETVERVRRTSPEFLGERRGQQLVGRKSVDVVAGHLVGEHDETYQLGRELQSEFGRTRIDPRVDLGHCEVSHFHGLTEMPARQLRHLRRCHHLVGALWIRHPTGRHSHLILGEVLPTHAADGRDFVAIDAVRERPSVRSDRGDEQSWGDRHSGHLRQMLEFLGQVVQ
jgi:hypothetical protein